MSPARVTVRTQGPTGPAGDPTTVADGAIAAAKIAGTAVVTGDARLSDARTPTAHRSSHEAILGSDPLTRFGIYPRIRRALPNKGGVTVERFGTAVNDLVQSGHTWAQSGNTNGNLNDTAVFRPNVVGGGGQSIRLQTDGAGTTAFVTAPRPAAKNMTGKAFRIWLRVDSASVAGLSAVQVYVGSGASAFANFDVCGAINFSTSVNIRGGKLDEWFPIHVNAAAINGAGSGTLDWTAVQDLRIRAVDANNGTQGKVWVGGVEVVPNDTARFPSGVVSLCFDDGWSTVYTRALPRMREYGYAGTAYVIRDRLGVAGRMTEAQVGELAADGWEIACHADTVAQHDQTNGYVDSTQAQRVAEWHNLQGYLNEKGWRGCEHIAWPVGAFNASMLADAAQTFAAARTIDDRQLETIPPADVMRLRARSVNQTSVVSPDTTVGSVLYQLAKIKLHGGWGIFVFHDVVASGATGIEINQATFDTILAYISSNGMTVRTVGDVLQV